MSSEKIKEFCLDALDICLESDIFKDLENKNPLNYTTQLEGCEFTPDINQSSEDKEVEENDNDKYFDISMNIMDRAFSSKSFVKMFGSEEKAQNSKDAMSSLFKLVKPCVDIMYRKPAENSVRGIATNLIDSIETMMKLFDSDSEDAIEYRFNQFKLNNNTEENVQVLFYMDEINKFGKDLKRLNYYLDKLIEYIEEHPDDKTILNDRKAQAYGRRAQVYHYRYDNEAALLDINKAMELYPDNISMYYLKISIEREMKNYQEALKNVEKALKIGDSPGLYFQRSLICKELDQLEKAKEDWRYIISNYDNDFYCGLSHLHLQEYQEALSKLERFIENEKVDDFGINQAHYFIGLIYLKLDRKEEARESFLKISDTFEGLKETAQKELKK